MKKLHIILTALNIVSIILLFQIIFGLIPSFECDYPVDKIDKINSLVIDLSLGVITSTFFYYILVYIPEKRKEKVIRSIISNDLLYIANNMQMVLAYVAKTYSLEVKDKYYQKIPLTEFSKIKKGVHIKFETICSFNVEITPSILAENSHYISTDVKSLNYTAKNILARIKNIKKKEEQQALYARVIPSGTINADKFVELVSKSNGFSPATIEGCLQAVSDELQHWLAQGWTVEVGEIGHFSLSLTCDRPVMEKKEIRSPSIHLNKVNLRINKKFRESLEPLQLERIESPYRTNNDSNEERCRTLLIQHLDKHGCITRTDFMRLAEISRNKAIELLNKFLKEEIIRKYGGGKTVVYLKK